MTRMSRNRVGGVSVFGVTLAVNAAKIEQGDAVSYGLWVQTLASDWVFLSGLTMRIDDEVVDFGSGSRLSAEVDCGGDSCRHDERYWFDATADQLRAIAAAQSVIVKLSGDGGYVEKEFGAGNIANFQDFVSEEVR